MLSGVDTYATVMSMSKPQAVIFDRDGTLASVDWCRPLARDQGTPREVARSWRNFHGMLPFDSVVPDVADMLRAVPDGVHRFMFSGRAAGDHVGDTHRRLQMLDWIRKNDLPVDTLMMRAGGDDRKDDLIKSEFLDLVLPHFDVVLVVDDRPQVCDMWRRRGMPLVQVVDPGLDPSFLLG